MLHKLFPDNQTTAYNTLILTGSIGLGKAQPLNSLVLTENGFKPMKDLTLKDKVFGNDGELHNILGIFPQGKKKVCRVTFSDKTSTECCDEHLWTVYNIDTDSQETLETREILTNGLFRKTAYKAYKYKIPVTEPIRFNSSESLPIHPYNLGVLIGGSSLTSVSAQSAYADPEILNATTYYKHIPEVYLHSDVESRIALLQGLMDTDGFISENGARIEFSTTSEQLKADFIYLVQSLGGICQVHQKQAKYFNKKYHEKRLGHICYSIGIRLPRSICPFKLQRKANKINSKALEPFRYITNIEYIEDQECQCIYIDSKDHLYLTNDFIVTHNTLVAVLAQLYLLYRMLCLKDPYEYFGLMPSDKITFSMLNITLETAKGVGWDKLQQLVQGSEWFMNHGSVNASRTAPTWQPDKHIELIFGSNNNHVIGRALFCLDGNTKIMTSDGEQELKSLVDKQIQVISVDDTGKETLSMPCKVKPTVKTNLEYKITLADDSIIECTENHLFKLTSGKYKMAKDLKETDELAEPESAEVKLLKEKK